MKTEPLTDGELMRVTTDPYTVSVKTIRRLAAELQAARQDAKRLDWLDEHAHEIYYTVPGQSRMKEMNLYVTKVRIAIDAASPTATPERSQP